MKTLRDDQVRAIDSVRGAVAHGQRRIILQMPTGGGKTVISADMANRALAKKKRVLVTVPMLSLIDQVVTMLGEQGVRDVGVIQAQHQMTDPTQPVQVASVQTLMRRTAIPLADLVVIDEIHYWFKFYERWLCDPAWQCVPMIGMSATPWAKGLGSYFQRKSGDGSCLIIANTIRDMIDQGTLAPFRVFAPTHPDLSRVRTLAGDYHEGDLFEVMKPPKLVADIVENWKALASDRPTVCFAVNRAHAEQIATEFERAGVPAGYMDCDTPLMKRATIRAALLSKKIKVICNVDVVGLGVDWPEVSCIIYARPTKSEMRYVQNIGRGLRSHHSKDHLLVLDHSDTTLRLGFVSDIHHDELDDGKPKLNGSRQQIALPKACPKCHYLKPPKTAKCPSCGFVAQLQPEPIRPAPGQLREISSGDIKKKPAPVAKLLESKAATYGQLMWYARKQNYRDGWAWHQYREIYGVSPAGSLLYDQHFHAPEMVLASWIKSRHIRRAFGQRKANGHVNGNGNGHTVGSDQNAREPAGMPRPAAGNFIPGTLLTKDDLEHF